MLCRMSRTTILVALFLAAGVLQAAEAPDKKPEQKAAASGSFLRLVRDKDYSPLALETSIVRCAPADGRREPIVDLVSAIHIADKSYYA
jgi:hypothetical protein